MEDPWGHHLPRPFSPPVFGDGAFSSFGSVFGESCGAAAQVDGSRVATPLQDAIAASTTAEAAPFTFSSAAAAVPVASDTATAAAGGGFVFGGESVGGAAPNPIVAPFAFGSATPAPVASDNDSGVGWAPGTAGGGFAFGGESVGGARPAATPAAAASFTFGSADPAAPIASDDGGSAPAAMGGGFAFGGESVGGAAPAVASAAAPFTFGSADPSPMASDDGGSAPAATGGGFAFGGESVGGAAPAVASAAAPFTFSSAAAPAAPAAAPAAASGGWTSDEKTALYRALDATAAALAGKWDSGQGHVGEGHVSEGSSEDYPRLDGSDDSSTDSDQDSDQGGGAGRCSDGDLDDNRAASPLESAGACSTTVGQCGQEMFQVKVQRISSAPLPGSMVRCMQGFVCDCFLFTQR